MSTVARHLVVVMLGMPLNLPEPTAAQATDCAGYDSQVWAQSVFETDPATYAALDPDGNGVACEDLTPGAAPALWTNAVPAQAVPVTLASVTDGDTIRVLINGHNEPARLILIDTPETNDPNNPVECFGQDATAFLTWLLSLGTHDRPTSFAPAALGVIGIKQRNQRSLHGEASGNVCCLSERDLGVA
jgi:hypothetical protein